jgi:hypothetical protein
MAKKNLKIKFHLAMSRNGIDTASCLVVYPGSNFTLQGANQNFIFLQKSKTKPVHFSGKNTINPSFTCSFSPMTLISFGRKGKLH